MSLGFIMLKEEYDVVMQHHKEEVKRLKKEIKNGNTHKQKRSRTDV